MFQNKYIVQQIRKQKINGGECPSTPEKRGKAGKSGDSNIAPGRGWQ